MLALHRPSMATLRVALAASAGLAIFALRATCRLDAQTWSAEAPFYDYINSVELRARGTEYHHPRTDYFACRR